jgi:phage gp16-like protein
MTGDKRKRDLAAIHASKKQLAMDDGSYREMLKQVTGKSSAKDLSAAGRVAVLRRMKALGAGKPQTQSSAYPGTPHNKSREPMLQKIEAQLADMKLPWAYADAIAKRQFGIERVAWLRTTVQLSSVIAALYKAQQKCKGDRL